MTNREKMEYHIRKAEEWQAEVLQWEDKALGEARRQPNPTQQSHLFIAAKLLEDHFRYRRAVANRNASQAQAKMYGIAAMVDAVSFPPRVTRYEGDKLV